MAHFAELDILNKVIRVVVISDDTPTSSGPLGENDKHIDGEKFCENFLKTGNKYKQTSYTRKFRGNFAGIGMIYDSQYDIFREPQPYSSWTLNTITGEWICPKTRPTRLPEDDINNPGYIREPVEFNSYYFQWDETNQVWKSKSGDKVWNNNTSSWE
jgi:hypothetical protein